MSGPVPNEEGLRALGREVAGSRSRRPRSRGTDHDGRSPAPATPVAPGAGDGSAASRGGDGQARPPGGGMGPGRTGRKPPARRRHRRLKRTLLVTGLVVLLLAGAAGGYGWYLDHEVHRVAVSGLTSGPTAGADAGTENILMVGSTTRCGLKHQTAAYGLCTQGVTGVNSDVIMVLHLNPSTKTVRLLSLPRDLFIPNARKTGTGYGAYKIDAALYQGPSQLVAAIEEDFGIPIQHYVELNFDTFAAVVTALGGITLTFPEPVFDVKSDLNVRVRGCHHLNGVEALQVVRARHLQYLPPGMTRHTPVSTWPHETQSDLARIRRDHEFLRVLASAVSKRGLSNPTTDLSLVNAVAGKLTVDSGLSVPHMVNLVLTYHGVNVNTAPQWTLPVRVGPSTGYTYKGFPKGDVEFPTQPNDQSTVDQLLGIGDATNSLTGKPLPSPQSVTVSVLNGTGAYNQATDTSQALGKLGFQMVGLGTSPPVSTVSETLVTYAHRTPVDEAAAQLVARSLSGSVIMDYGPTADGADVTVTTGSSFSVNPTAPTTTTTTAPTKGGSSITSSTSSSATTVATPAGSAGGTSSATSSSSLPSFSAPTPAFTPLKPYDPRACPAGVKGNSTGWGS